MRKLIMLFLLVTGLPFILNAQSPVERVLQEVEKNNTTLSALRSRVEAEKTGNRTGIFLHNPEMDLYLLNNRDEQVQRTNFNLVQPFDFPTLLGRKNQLSRALNQQLDYEYLQHRQDVLLEAHQIVIDLIYLNALGRELEIRLEHAANIARSYEAMLNAGEVNILEHNKAQINLFNSRKASELNAVERASLLARLQALNGGIELEVSEKEFPVPQIPGVFAEWFEEAAPSNPFLLGAAQQIAISRQEERLARAAWLPSFSAGYMVEALPAERFAGFGMGISIPLWENRNTVKYARLHTEAMQQRQTDIETRYFSQLKGMYDQAKSLQELSLNYRSMLQNLDNSGLLLKALEAGQISLIDYMLELGFYYEAVNMMLETDRQLHKVIANLKHFSQ
ncbi:MAG: TolC family protein [Bacteroidales bacterium]|nr:TolC family protein [Bacteroidales bacterium]